MVGFPSSCLVDDSQRSAPMDLFQFIREESSPTFYLQAWEEPIGWSGLWNLNIRFVDLSLNPLFHILSHPYSHLFLGSLNCDPLWLNLSIKWLFFFCWSQGGLRDPGGSVGLMFHIQPPSLCLFSVICIPTIKITHCLNPKAFLGFHSQLRLIYHEVVVSCFPRTSNTATVHPSTIQLPKFCSLLSSILIISFLAVLRGYPICSALWHVSTEGVELNLCVSSRHSLEALIVLGNISGVRSWKHGAMNCYSRSAGMVGMGWEGRAALSSWRHTHSDGEEEPGATWFLCANKSVKIMFAWWSKESCSLGLNEHQATQT